MFPQGFLAALEAALQRVSAGGPGDDRPPWYTVEGTQGTEEAGVQAVCGTLEVLGRAGAEGRAALLASSGLQEDRTQLLLAQHDHHQRVGSARRQPGVPLKDLVDVQWKLGVVAGSSEEGEAGRTFVQVNFICQAPGDTRREARLVEMSLEKFYDFLHQLEKCRASLELGSHSV
ncbi:COMM domain-containing protein 7 [Chionoecetes opilio]|uniref:COMM domain-containing protein 7 n=1 Tax=Chionoecetes opilio TaxID=41210 RepID=A0A8J4YHR1_CHIOP|nr:COMM domain-containing protein 7 [Chionoecetes opilio]